MAKQYETKNRIMLILDKKVLRLKDICNELGLKPSTIYEHLEELIDFGYVMRIGRYYGKKL